ncbi:hypothetical protein [Pseudomonas benzenivorans]|uniref:Uncharacterized protein n=1 Tax=Pseudomonas benzenivorans TaxID=556533 RepID=A0ABY5H0K9_9PSED|nr:hypothetical protein [Pseudomonas benzenivorans]UTW05791.1 hypothetical protein KDW96_11365 [Pseudomonas benzenivorans]
MTMSPQVTTSFATYPRKVFIGEQDAANHYCVLMITEEELDQLHELIAEQFGQTTIELGQTAHAVSVDEGALKLSARREFNGLIIELVTNSKTFLERLDASFKAPPSPWFAFPDMQPIEAIMNKQGSLEYWWDWIWNPFWEHASAETRADYLSAHKASDEWIECLAGQANGSD